MIIWLEQMDREIPRGFLSHTFTQMESTCQHASGGGLGGVYVKHLCSSLTRAMSVAAGISFVLNYIYVYSSLTPQAKHHGAFNVANISLVHQAAKIRYNASSLLSSNKLFNIFSISYKVGTIKLALKKVIPTQPNPSSSKTNFSYFIKSWKKLLML